ncbi:MAG: hypothetical protein OSB57_00450 [Planctomycetota bacterium]|nr:hypothetical protein [Planctomycetota bacterium]
MNLASWTALLVTLVATPILARAALAFGFVDSRESGLALRKPRENPVPPVGGIAVLLGLVGAALCGEAHLPWAALLAAFGLGLVDDLRPGGLSPLVKFAGQCVVGCVLGWSLGDGAESIAALSLVAVVAMNAANTFDCADGACGTLGVVGLAGRSVAAPALLGFLPWNVFFRRGSERVPIAYLGDSGSHLVGVLLAGCPEAWGILLLPLLDLGRLSLVRIKQGRRPWDGDRLHLAHALERRGLSNLGVLGLLLAILLGLRLALDWPAWLPG